MRLRISFTDVLLFLLALALAVGVMTLFQPCVHDDGSFGTCHWAGMAVFGAALALCVQALSVLLAGSRRVKIGLLVGMVPTALLAALTPGLLIPLCTMSTMRCQSLTRPFALVAGLLIAVLAVVDALLQQRKIKQRSH